MKIEIDDARRISTASTITITKLAVNQKLDDDQFDLKFPEGVTPKVMRLAAQRDSNQPGLTPSAALSSDQLRNARRAGSSAAAIAMHARNPIAPR